MSTNLGSSNWNYPTSIWFGPGRVGDLANAARDLGMEHPLLVTDRGLVGLQPELQASEALRAAGLPFFTFSDFEGNPTGADVMTGVEVFRQGSHDGVIALGGGSALDVGKAIALMSGQQLQLWDLEDVGDWWTRADPDGIAPIVAVPTTAGTGSEVGRCSVVVNQAQKRKVVIFHPAMLPGRVIADPGLTIGLPPGLTAAVGMDALSHNLEALCAPGFHPMADGIAVEGICLIARSLVRAVRDGTDLEARADLLVAATMGATAFQKGLGAMHALSHPIGAHLGSHHGLTNAVVMPYVLSFNREAVTDRLAEVAQLLGKGRDFESFFAWVLELRRELGIPNTLEPLGFLPEHAAELAPEALKDPTASTNPVELTEMNLEGLYQSALSGTY